MSNAHLWCYSLAACKMHGRINLCWPSMSFTHPMYEANVPLNLLKVPSYQYRHISIYLIIMCCSLTPIYIIPRRGHI